MNDLIKRIREWAQDTVSEVAKRTPDAIPVVQMQLADLEFLLVAFENRPKEKP